MTDYVFAGSVRLRIRSRQRLARVFAAEYGEIAAHLDDIPDVEVDLGYGGRVAAPPGGALLTGGHKSARWRVALGPSDARPLRASIALGGGPPAFVLSLVQGYVVEALVAVALARGGRVALPGAGFVQDGGATVLLGRSGAGKTTLTARALAAGRTVLSDDQVVLDPATGIWRYPRRLRFYPDIEQTAPDAWSRLPSTTRASLGLRGSVRRLTRGYVAPSLAVPADRVGSTVVPGPVPLRRLVVVERVASGGFAVVERGSDWAVEQAVLVLADQRARLAAAVSGEWARALSGALDAERTAVAGALAGVPVTEVRLPRAWAARRSVDTLGAHLGITPGPAAPPGGPSQLPR